MLQFQMMELLFARLQNLTDSELMTRRQIEMELGHNLKNVNKTNEGFQKRNSVIFHGVSFITILYINVLYKKNHHTNPTTHLSS